TVFSEPQLDLTHRELPALLKGETALGVEFLPGQYDQRADSAAQCIQFMTAGERPLVKSAKIYLFSGDLSEGDRAAMKSALINPVEAQEALLEMPQTLQARYEIPESVETLRGFLRLDKAGIQAFAKEHSLAMDENDLLFCQTYFRDEEGRDPTITELKMIDTYWSDHCRHTTFLTEIEGAEIAHPGVKKSFEEYKLLRAELGREDRPMTLMDIATIGAKALKLRGLLGDLDESDEINACSVKVGVEVDGRSEEWLLQFKNETHNHPTEIEPFGGAATCLGGAIRDPLSGRSYVYQAMRVTGSGDPTAPISDTIKGKLPQRKISQTAAAGFSAYGNQIGLATGHVAEIYHPGYTAKRMEIGAVLGASPAAHIRRETPKPGDLVILLGGRTGRDGIGGATGSSKSHTLQSLESCGAEVQKGNPPEERKLQRLMRDPGVAGMILRCNDFGAGGVSVAIGELADGLIIDLNAVPKKYEGLDGTELAISESQERMAVVVGKGDAERFILAANKENLEATIVAEVTSSPRLVMNWNGKKIVDIAREFLNSNGAPRQARVKVEAPQKREEERFREWRQRALELFADLNICSQKGLVERFDSTIGAGTVLMPFGGKEQLSPSQAMAAKLPVLRGETDDCSLMAWGFDPYMSSWDPYTGAMWAVVHSVAKVIAAGGSLQRCWLTLQEYFERLRGEPRRWGKPFAALLGALRAQMGLGVAAIGGKDSMSGSFEDIDVPPTLVSFAVSMGKASEVVSTEFKKAGNAVWLLKNEQGEERDPEFSVVRRTLSTLEELIASGKVESAYVIGRGGLIEALGKMCFGNRLGVNLSSILPDSILFDTPFCAAVLEVKPEISLAQFEGARHIGVVSERYEISHMGEALDLDEVQAAFEGTLQGVFPYLAPSSDEDAKAHAFKAEGRQKGPSIARPRALIPVFPGTNCEYDTARAFERAGIAAEVFVICNQKPSDIDAAIKGFVEKAKNAQIIALPGGFSGGDEPEGSAKFVTSFLRNPYCRDAIHELLKQRDGLMLGVCNGFQALVKLGLVPFGEIIETDEHCPTLTFNAIGRHQSRLVTTRVSSTLSPWLQGYALGQTHTVAISHGEGRFVASPELLDGMAKKGQIATQYVGEDERPSMGILVNPNHSVDAIEGITSPDGRVLGKMAHSERMGENLYKNVPGDKAQNIFESAALYYR
ncbi:MAG: phosphoribosylformylglycinamidine synthase, partial [Christensenellaceae bacterium]|nr:phosphoribosylformylglycinamidine synthase [Christensenellaceae bacterium]